MKELDSFYVSQLRKQNKSLEIDSLISSHLSITRYEPFNLEFIEYYPQYRYRDIEQPDHFSINLVRNYHTGKIYFDFINWHAGDILEDFCAYSSIDMSQARSSAEAIKTYVSIKSKRRFGDWETSPAEKRTGIEAFLNEEFRFKRTSKAELDSLFTFYNKVHKSFERDSLINDPINLVQYLAHQATAIKSRYHTNEDLIYLKDQINLLIARNSKCDSINNFQWIYKSSHRLHERMVSIKGSEKTFYHYSVEERNFVFKEKKMPSIFYDTIHQAIQVR